jgi:Ca2+-binding RTX toxin-like protein
LYGGSGHDVLKGHEGHDLLIGDSGNDELYGWEGNDVLDGGDGDDYLSGWTGSDLLIGGKGDDHLRGHAGRDLLIGGKNTDRLDGGSGQDILIGGWTKYDPQYDTLEDILAAWNSHDSLEVRKLRLTQGEAELPAISKWAIKIDGKQDALRIDVVDVDWLLMDHKDYTTYLSS